MIFFLRLPQADAVIVDHVFQPLVDLLGIDPELWAWRLFRIFALAYTTSAAGLATMTLLGMNHFAAFDGLFAIPVGMFAVIVLAERMLRHPSHPLFDLIGPPFRLLLLTLAVWGLPVIILSIVGRADASLLDAAGQTPFLLRMAAFSMSVALPGGVSALYVRICRRPPPRSPRGKVEAA